VNDLWRVLGIAAFAVWPIVPIIWVQVHAWPNFWRKLGGLTYAMVISEWLVVASLAVIFRNFLLGERLDLGILSWLGVIPLISGLALNIWTARQMSLRVLVGYPELKPNEGQRLITTGPFSVMRHPAYLAHILMLAGVFLITGYIGTGFLALFDLLISDSVIIPLEERELEARFGDPYREYKRRVGKFLPRLVG
jgi:protein-S-isoprenylcysteine O-methyltransferase Ste14